MKILYDHDIKDFISYRGCIEILEELLYSKLRDNVVHPPREYFPTQKGAMIFTKGELIEEKVAGFRLYGGPKGPKSTQMTLVMDTHSGEFKGQIIGKLLGVYRTACINAVAIKHLSRIDSQRLGVLGSGFQARHHALAALEVRDIRELRVYSRDPAKRSDFIRFVEANSGRENLNIVSAESPEEVAEHSDILICATNSKTPILKTESLKPGLHINNIGPKYKGSHELPLDAYHKAEVLATDTLAQLFAGTGPGTVCFADTIPEQGISGLEHYMHAFERSPEAITLFCSIGLAGSEVALANWILEAMKEEAR